MLFVNVERGREEGTALAKKLEEELSSQRNEAYVAHHHDAPLSQDLRDELEQSFSYQHS
jgi:UMF1 family MFS transporter